MNRTAKFQLTGAVLRVGETQAFQSGFKKRDVVVDCGFRFPSPIAVQLLKDDVALADGIKVGDEVTVEGFVNGREWQGQNGTRYFTDLTVAKLAVTGTEVVAPNPAPKMPAAPAEDDADIPF